MTERYAKCTGRDSRSDNTKATIQGAHSWSDCESYVTRQPSSDLGG